MSPAAPKVTHTLRLHLRVVGSPAGVRWAVQLGKDGLLAPTAQRSTEAEFEIPLELVSVPGGEAKLRGPAMQGPRGGRFVYLTVGSRAGDPASPWNRRAKISLEHLPLDAILARPADTPVALVGEIGGTAKDGGPACASVPLLGGTWVLADRR